MSRVVLLANEPPWPPINGGRARMAGLVEGLLPDHEVVVLVPTHARHEQLGHSTEGVTVIELPPATRRPRAVSLRRPLLTASLLDGKVIRAVREHLTRLSPDALLCTHSYLAAIDLPIDLPVIVDFPNIEVDRSRSLATAAGARRWVHLLESVKARRWEPRAARAAALCLAVTAADQARLRAWGASDVMLVPNVASAPEPAPSPSPPGGYALVLAGGGYSPNARALTWLVREVWPQVVTAKPDARLVVAGPKTRELCEPLAAPGVEARGYVDDLDPLFREAAVVLAPVSAGAGSQLKVVTSLAHGRTLVATTYSSASVPEPQRFAVTTADDGEAFAAAVLESLSDVAQRHRRENQLARHPLPDWRAAVAPLSAFARGLEQSSGSHRPSEARRRSS